MQFATAEQFQAFIAKPVNKTGWEIAAAIYRCSDGTLAAYFREAGVIGHQLHRVIKTQTEAIAEWAKVQPDGFRCHHDAILAYFESHPTPINSGMSLIDIYTEIMKFDEFREAIAWLNTQPCWTDEETEAWWKSTQLAFIKVNLSKKYIDAIDWIEGWNINE